MPSSGPPALPLLSSSPSPSTSFLRQTGRFYLRRYLRIMPAYAVALGFFYALTATSSSEINQAAADFCAQYVWRNVLFINNFFPYSDLCMGWSWSIALEVQMYLVSPPIVWATLRWPRRAGALLGVLAATSLAAYLALSVYVYSPAGQADDGVLFTDWVYDKPYTRMFAYLFGMLVALWVERDQGNNTDSAHSNNAGSGRVVESEGADNNNAGGGRVVVESADNNNAGAGRDVESADNNDEGGGRDVESADNNDEGAARDVESADNKPAQARRVNVQARRVNVQARRVNVVEGADKRVNVVEGADKCVNAVRRRWWTVILPRWAASLLVLTVVIGTEYAPDVEEEEPWLFWLQTLLARPLFCAGMAYVMYDLLSPRCAGDWYHALVSSVLASGPLYFFAQLSYGIYLFHFTYIMVGYYEMLQEPVRDDRITVNSHWIFPVFALTFYAMSAATALVDYFLIEKPMMNLAADLVRDKHRGASASRGAG